MSPVQGGEEKRGTLDQLRVRLVREGQLYGATLVVLPAGIVLAGPARDSESAARADGELLLDALVGFEIVDRTYLPALWIPDWPDPSGVI